MALVLELSMTGGLPLPVVLTHNHQVKRLAITDFPVPVTPIDRIRIPNWFSARSARHKRDLAATMRNKLAGRNPGKPARQPAADNAEIARLRRLLRQHPCHSCPDRELHARQAEKQQRLEREAEAFESRVAGRSHVIARTFDRVCALLEQRGYLDGDRVTAEGKRLAGLYTELDLLTAESLRLGLWDGLGPAELAACVSALTFESRKPDDSAPSRPPPGRCREVLGEMRRVWNELDSAEKEHQLSFLRELDDGFAWAAHAWVQGQRLERLLSPDLTPGDFVRTVKQLIDLLDQIAAAAGPVPVAGTARAAIDALRRGVVAYSSVG
jgi:ATP-dependent RNA helicase HelY